MLNSTEGVDGGTVMTGSQPVYGWNGRKPHHSVNFVTVHDGFTLYDLFSYDERQNDCGLLNPKCCDDPLSVWCDTEYAFYGGRDLSVDEILSEVGRLGGDCRLVELTGGEPLLQRDIGELARRLLDSGYTVLCETSGSLPVDRVPPEVVKIVDLKPPGSGEASSNDWRNLAMLDPQRDELKFVIANREDYEWAARQVRERDLARFADDGLRRPGRASTGRPRPPARGRPGTCPAARP